MHHVLDRLACLDKQIGDRRRGRVDVGQSGGDVGSCARASPSTSWDSLSKPSENSWSRVAKVCSTVFRLVITSPISSLRPARVDGQRRGLRQHREQGAALPLENPQQLAGQGVDLIGIQRPEQRAETADQCVDVQCGRSTRQRNRRARRQPAWRPGALFEREIAVTDQVFVAHDGFGALGEPQSFVDGEVDADRAVAMQA